MVSQLIAHERIETTVQKAKELRRVADRVITLGKEVIHGRLAPPATPLVTRRIS
jgi:ribosomal protein L17